MSTPVAAYERIIAQIGDTPTNVLARNVPGLWDDYAGKAGIDPALQALYVRRDALDMVLAYYRERVDFQDERVLSAKMSQQTDHIQAMRADVVAEICRIEGKARARRPGATGQLATTAPINPPCPGEIDANSPVLRGSPYYRINRAG